MFHPLSVRYFSGIVILMTTRCCRWEPTSYCNAHMPESKAPTLMGILNLTPDSFSDGGEFQTLEAALRQVDTMLDEGAGIIDIGAESTRPGAHPLPIVEEKHRLDGILPQVVQRVHRKGGIVSMDTRHASTAAWALSLGVDWINDVSGGEDPEMVRIIAAHDCRYVVMHHLGIAADRDITLPDECDVVQIVYEWLEEKIRRLVSYGIARERLIADPGIGFGKSAQQSIRLMENIGRFHALGVELLVGHSRKSFLSAGSTIEDRDNATVSWTCKLMQEGVHYVRVHNVAGNKK
ncbi:MAG: dihydropteroate synthase, partial [Anaerolineae bacterium]|nr:dihydropteroate synthase [Anaerolineae bacterium]